MIDSSEKAGVTTCYITVGRRSIATVVKPQVCESSTDGQNHPEDIQSTSVPDQAEEHTIHEDSNNDNM